MFPLYDDEFPSFRPPFVTISLIVITVLIFAFSYFYVESSIPQNIIAGEKICKLEKEMARTEFEKLATGISCEYLTDKSIVRQNIWNNFFNKFGLIPDNLFKNAALLSLITYIFIHGGIAHLLGNMWFLWLFGNNVEYNMGKLKFLIFYLATGAISGLIYSLISSDKNVALIGASGAISGILGAYLILYPNNEIKTLIFTLSYVKIIHIPSSIFIGIWFIFQLLYLLLGATAFSGIAYLGHIGGFAAGLLLVRFFRRNIIIKNYYEGSN